MEGLLTPSNIMFVIGIIGTIFGIYLYFRTPQEETETKAALLKQQVDITNDDNSRKFIELGSRIDSAMTLAQNHIHTVDTKVDNLTAVINGLSNEVTRLATIIDERVPSRRTK